MKDIKGYEGRYAVTSCGKVWSYRRNKFLAPIPAKDGYTKVNLYDENGKMRTFQIHRLVAEAYIPNIDNLPVVNHCSERKNQNNVQNLEWATQEYNINYGTRNQRASAALKDRFNAEKRLYCPELDMYFCGQIEVSRQLGIDQGDISKHLSGKRKSAGKHPVTGEKLHWQKVS